MVETIDLKTDNGRKYTRDVCLQNSARNFLYLSRALEHPTCVQECTRSEVA